MKSRRRVFGLGLLVVFSIACALVGQTAPRPSGTQETPATPANQGKAGVFSAQANSPASVSLEWQAVDGASGYLLKGRYGEGDFFQAAQLPAGATGFTHFVVPGSAQVTYRLSALTSAGNQPFDNVVVIIPELTPNPLLVESQPFAPSASGMPDFSGIPTIDPKNPDPQAMATLEALAGSLQSGASQPQLKPVYVQQQIGAQGGKLTLTSPNGAVFALEIPAGAVAETTTFILTPIETVTQFPFAGGPLAAVKLHPPVPFKLPLGLTVTLPEGQSAPGSALTVGFAVSSLNHELSLAPIYKTGGNTYRMNVYWGDTFGLAAATAQEVEAQTGRIPSDSGEQAAQQLAALQAFNTDPSPEGLSRIFAQVMEGLSVRTGKILSRNPAGANAHLAAPAISSGPAPRLQSQSGAGLWESLTTWERVWSEEQNNPLYDRGNPLYQPLNPDSRAELIRNMAQAIHTFLEAHDGCRTKQDLYAESFLQILRNPDGDFQGRIAAEYKSKFGDAELEKSCTFMLHIVSSRIETTVKDQDGSLIQTVKVHTEPFELELVVRGNRFALRGAAGVTYDGYNIFFTNCPPDKDLSLLPTAAIWITDLKPIFGSDDRVTDFVLQGAVPDPIAADSNQGTVTTETDSPGNCRIADVSLTSPPPDWWGMTFPSMHSPYMQEDHWVLVGDESYVATDTISNRVESIGTEDTLIVLTVNKR